MSSSRIVVLASSIEKNYDWVTYKIIVDLGDLQGNVGLELNKCFLNIKCVVQDLPEVIAGAQKDVDRVEFWIYDFFTGGLAVADYKCKVKRLGISVLSSSGTMYMYQPKHTHHSSPTPIPCSISEGQKIEIALKRISS